MSQAEFDARDPGQKSLQSAANGNKDRTMMTWVKFKPLPMGTIYGGKKRYQTAVGLGMTVSASQWNIAATNEGTPLLYVGQEHGEKNPTNSIYKADGTMAQDGLYWPMWTDTVMADKWVLVTTTCYAVRNASYSEVGGQSDKSIVGIYLNDGTKSFVFSNQTRSVNTGNGAAKLKIGKGPYTDVVQYPAGCYDIITAGNILSGKKYRINILGDTNWNSVAGTTGQTYKMGDVFTAVRAGSTAPALSNKGQVSEVKVYTLDAGGGAELRAAETSPSMSTTQFSGHESLNGSVGMVTYYNRVLTPAEIRQYYTATKGNYQN
jgi:hypothetical protein